MRRHSNQGTCRGPEVPARRGRADLLTPERPGDRSERSFLSWHRSRGPEELNGVSGYLALHERPDQAELGAHLDGALCIFAAVAVLQLRDRSAGPCRPQRGRLRARGQRDELRARRRSTTGTRSSTAPRVSATSVFQTDTADRRFTGGSKDTLDVSQWAWDSQSGPDKDDILHAYAGLYENGGDEITVFGLDRFANNGDANVGFWFFQNAIGVNADGTFSGVHKNGDVFIVSEFDSRRRRLHDRPLQWLNGGLSQVVSGDRVRRRRQRRDLRHRQRRDRAFPLAVHPQAGTGRDASRSRASSKAARTWAPSSARAPVLLDVPRRDPQLDLHHGRAQELPPRHVQYLPAADDRDPAQQRIGRLRRDRHRHGDAVRH